MTVSRPFLTAERLRGLPIPLHDEFGEIKPALAFVPALPPMRARSRLEAGVSFDGLGPQAKVVARARTLAGADWEVVDTSSPPGPR